MRRDAPAWWYQTETTKPRRLIGVLGWLYGQASARRMQRAPSFTAPIPVICIGNFTVGGTGKTPLALLVADLLIARGERPAFLTRGYGGRVRQPRLVDRSLDTARDVGDEALLLAVTAPTMVSPDRTAGARALMALPHPPTVIVMDDGLQNPGLAKTLSLAVVDGMRGIGNGRVVPAGPLRAPLDLQMARVDAVIVNVAEVGQARDDTIAQRDHSPLAQMRSRYKGPVLTVAAEPVGDVGWLAGRKLVAFAGIGNPQRFFDLVRRLGGDLMMAVPYGDHQALSERDAAELIDTAQSVGADLVTTEKDLARLTGYAGRRAELADAARVLAIRLVMPPADRERLAILIEAALTAPRGGAAV